MIVIALLAILGAIVLPALSTWAADYRFAGMLDQFGAAMDRWRVHALKRGRAVVVEVIPQGARLTVVARDVNDVADEADASPDAARRDGPIATFLFPEGVRPDLAEPQASAGERDGGSVPDPGRAAPGEELAILLPDGTAGAGGGWRVRDGGGRCAELAVDHWSGAVRLRRAAPLPAPSNAESR